MSCRKLPSGKFEVRWREGSRNRSRTFTLRKDAVAFDLEIQRIRQLGGTALAKVSAGRRTLDSYIEEVWRPQHLVTLAPASQRTYEAMLRNHVRDQLGSLRLCDITPAGLRAWQAERVASGAGIKSLNHTLTVLGGILQRALEDEEIASNPARIVRKIPTDPSAEVRPLAPLAIELVRAELDPVSAVLASVLAYAGLRPSEAWALTWGDVRDRTLIVRRATDGEGDLKTTKTRSVRSVRLLEPLARDLAEHRLASGRPEPHDLLFVPQHGRIATKDDQSSWRKWRWQPAYRAAVLAVAERANAESGSEEARDAARSVGLDPNNVPRLYDLRHSFCSLLLAEGRTVHYVAGQLGHGPEQTLSRYGHVLDELADAPQIDAEAEIRRARDTARTLSVRSSSSEDAA
jgi:integrase